MDDYPLAEWRSELVAARFVVAVTGAGISYSSGLPLEADHVEGVPLREFFRPHLLRSDPQRFFDAYRAVLKRWRSATPNAAHVALAKRGIWVVTQNIDGLHRDAETDHLIELHGNLRELTCPSCNQYYGSDLAWQESVPHCPACGSGLRPGVSLEGSEVRHFSLAVDWVGRAQIVLIIGTTLEMDPVRQLPQIATSNGAKLMYINRAAELAVPKLLAMLT